MENLNTFADVFGIKEIDEQKPDSETAVHIATIQGMVQRVLYPSENNPPPAVDQYDCIIVDECHRGYLLDRELSETEMTFRSFDDYVSKYRRVLDYFAAVKIGLTATPALHTTEIFGAPIYMRTVRVADLEIDLAARRAQRGGRVIELTAKEFALLECFALHPDEVLDRAMITAHVWDDNHDPFTNVLEVLVRRLRRKLDDDFEPKLIHTMRGAGYRLGV